jgi:hypothetical protein
VKIRNPLPAITSRQPQMIALQSKGQIISDAWYQLTKKN